MGRGSVGGERVRRELRMGLCSNGDNDDEVLFSFMFRLYPSITRWCWFNKRKIYIFKNKKNTLLRLLLGLFIYISWFEVFLYLFPRIRRGKTPTIKIFFYELVESRDRNNSQYYKLFLHLLYHIFAVLDGW
jgi:hypothetical protein